MKTRPLLVLSIALLTASYFSITHAQMKSRSQGTGEPIVNPGRSTSANLNGASQAPLSFDLSGIAFSGNSPVSLPMPSGGSGTGGVTYSSSTPSVCTVNGNSLIPVSPGTCTIVASKGASGVYGSTSVSATKVIPLINQLPLAFSIPTLSFSNGVATLPAPTGGSGTGAITYLSETPSICSINGTSVTALGIGTCAITATKAGSDALGPVSARAEFAIAAQPQAPLSLNISSLTFGSDGTATLPAASGGSGAGAITYTASGSCSLSGTTLTANAPGNCSVTATKAASGIYSATTSSPSSVTISARAQAALTFSLAGVAFNGSDISLAASGGSGSGAISYSVKSGSCTIVNSSSLRVSALGSCTVTAEKAASGLYSAATPVDSTITVALQNQAALTISASPSTITSGGTTTLSHQGGTGSGAVVYSVQSGSCSISGSTLTAPNAAGSCVVRATKASNTFFNAATSNDLTFTVACAAGRQVTYRVDASCNLASRADLATACETNPNDRATSTAGYDAVCYSDGCVYRAPAGCGGGTCEPWELRSIGLTHSGISNSAWRSSYAATAACRNW